MTAVSTAAARAAERAARESYGKLVAILAARDHDIASAEDALSDALSAALQTWPVRGVPINPEGWLVTTARNIRRNVARRQAIRKRAEPQILQQVAEDEDLPGSSPMPDNRLNLMFVCAHPAIDAAARTPLILQTMLGFEAARIARAFLVPPATMSQRLVRAKARIRDAGIAFALPGPEDLSQRLAAVLDAIYTAFGAGWDEVERSECPDAITGEAIWLARLMVDQLPAEPEPKGLLALMLYCDARRAARRDDKGHFVPLDRQDGDLWDRTKIVEAEGLLTQAARAGRFGRFQCEAAIQSVHVQRPITGKLNLRALRSLYDLLVEHTGSLGARIGRAVVIAEAGDVDSAKHELEALPKDRVAVYQPWWVARARVASLAGDVALQRDCLQRAIDLTEDQAIKGFLLDQYSGPH